MKWLPLLIVEQLQNCILSIVLISESYFRDIFICVACSQGQQSSFSLQSVLLFVFSSHKVWCVYRTGGILLAPNTTEHLHTLALLAETEPLAKSLLWVRFWRWNSKHHMTVQPMDSSQSPRFKKEAVLERLWIQYKYLSFHLSLNLIFFLYISLCARVGKFYCKQHYGYRLVGMAQRKRPAPITAPPHATQVRLSLAHLSRQSWRTHKTMITRVRSILMKLHCSPGGSECSTVGWMDSLETPDSITSWLPGLIGVLEYEMIIRRTGIGELWFMGFPFLNSLVDIKLKQMST